MGTGPPDRDGHPSAARDGPDLIGATVGVFAVNRRPAVDPSVVRRRSSMIDNYVRLVNDVTVLRAVPLQVTGQSHAVATALINHSATISAAFVVGLAAPQSAVVQRRVAEAAGPVVLAYVDVVTAAYAAAVLTTLRSLDVPRQRARVAVSDAEPTPHLGPILIACGIGQLTTWHHHNAPAYPRRQLRAHHDVVISPNPAAPMLAAGDCTLRMRKPSDLAGLVLPGLLSALCGHGIGALQIAHLAAAADGVALITPAGQTLPTVSEPLLVTTIARRVAQTLTQSH